MDPILVSAASGMKARSESLDMLANNIANTQTAGFKADREFNSLYQSELPLVQSQWTDYSQAPIVPSGNPLNAALTGPGFFALNSPGGIVYSRNGQFQISSKNELQTAEGYTIRNAADQGKPIVVDPALPIDIDKTGTVRQGGVVRGQMEVVAVDNPHTALKKMGSSYFTMVDAGTATKPVASTTEVQQDYLEQSNVPIADSAVRMVSVMRQFDMLQRAITMSTEMSRHALEEVAKVS